MRKKKKRLKRSVIFLLIVVVFLLFGFQKLQTSFAQLEQHVLGDKLQDVPINDVTALGNDIYSTNAILVDLTDDKVLCKKNSSVKCYPASLTKIMTTIVAIENINDLDDLVLLPASMFEDLYEAHASMGGFLPNEEVKAIDLLYATMLPSGAEAAEGLALYVSGSQDDFVKLMNEKAEELGMTNTHFANVSGLQDANHYTTVADLAILLEYALQNDTFREIFNSPSHFTPATNLHPNGITFNSTLFTDSSTISFDGGEIIGGKTGYTAEAGLCLASLAQKDGKEYILVTTGASGNHETEQYNVTDALYIYNNYLK